MGRSLDILFILKMLDNMKSMEPYFLNCTQLRNIALFKIVGRISVWLNQNLRFIFITSVVPQMHIVKYTLKMTFLYNNTLVLKHTRRWCKFQINVATHSWIDLRIFFNYYGDIARYLSINPPLSLIPNIKNLTLRTNTNAHGTGWDSNPPPQYSEREAEETT